MPAHSISLSLPDWTIDELARLPEFLPTREERMAAVIRFSRLNIEHGTGGPFAAGVFERDSGRVVVVGVNRVLDSGFSSAHAEVMTLSVAMCFGATLWSGIRSLVISGSDPELEEITGFDEGPITPDWEAELLKRGITVTNNVLREEAMAVFRQFRDSRQFVYNARQG